MKLVLGPDFPAAPPKGELPLFDHHLVNHSRVEFIGISRLTRARYSRIAVSCVDLRNSQTNGRVICPLRVGYIGVHVAA